MPVKLQQVIKPGQLGKFEGRLAKNLRTARLKALHDVGRSTTRMLAFASKGIKDLGTYGAGWRYKAAFDRLYLSNAAAHAIYVERGRRPGSSMPPLAPIRAWALRHGMQASAAWPIAKKIAERGIAPRPVLLNPTIMRGIQSTLEVALASALADAASKATT